MWRATLSQLRSRSFCSISAGIISFTTNSRLHGHCLSSCHYRNSYGSRLLSLSPCLQSIGCPVTTTARLKDLDLMSLSILFYSALFNATLIFFILLINDRGPVVSADYLLICVSFLLLLLFTYSGRLLITSSAFRRARKKNIRNNVLIIGTSIQGHKIYDRLIRSKVLIKYNIVGFIHIEGVPKSKFCGLPCWNVQEIENICRNHEIHQIILALTEIKIPLYSECSTVSFLLTSR